MIPDDAGVTINGNWNVDIVNVKIESENAFGYMNADLQLTSGFSITKDSVLDEMFRQKTSIPGHETR